MSDAGRGKPESSGGLNKLNAAHSSEDDVIFIRPQPVTYRPLTQAISQPDESLRINVPKTSSPHVSRDTYVHTLHEKLRSRPVVLVGDECVGKSMLAADYVAKFKMRSQDVIWISANGQPWLDQQFYEITRHPQWTRWVSPNLPVVAIPQSTTNSSTQNVTQSTETKVTANDSTQVTKTDLASIVYRALSARGSFIVVIDDAVPFDLLKYLPPTNAAANARVLITSRLPASEWRGFDVITVQELLKTEQPRMFAEPITTQPSIRQSSVPILTGDKEAICQTLAGQPLLLNMAAGFIKTAPQKTAGFAQSLKRAQQGKEDVAVLCCDTVIAAAAQNKNAGAILTLCSLIAPNHIPGFLFNRIVADKDIAPAVSLLQGLGLLRAEHDETKEVKKDESKDVKDVKESMKPKQWYSVPRTIQTAVIFKTNLEQRLLQTCLQAVQIIQDTVADEKVPENDRISLLAHGYCLLALSVNLKVIDTQTLAPLGKELVKLALLVGDKNKVDAINTLIQTAQPIKLSMPDKFEWDSPYFAPASNIFPSDFNVTVFERCFLKPMYDEEVKQQQAAARSSMGKDVKDVKNPMDIKKKVPLTIADVDDKIEPFFITDYCPLPVYPKAFQLFVDLIRAWLAGQFCALSGEQKTNEVKRRREEFVKEFTQSSLHHSFSATSHAHAYLIRIIGKIASYFTTYWRRDYEFADGALQLLDFMHAFGAAGQRMFQAFAKHELGDKAIVFRFERLYGPVEYVDYPRLQTSSNPQPIIMPSQVTTTINPGQQPTSTGSDSTKYKYQVEDEARAKLAHEQHLAEERAAAAYKANIKIGSHLIKKLDGSREEKENEWIFKSEWRSRTGPVWGSPTRLNQELLEWAKKEGKANWFNLTDPKKLKEFLSDLYGKSIENEKLDALVKRLHSEELLEPELHAMYDYEDEKQILAIFLENTVICSHALWYGKKIGTTATNGKETKENSISMTADEFILTALNFMRSPAYTRQDLNYTRDLRIHHLYHLFDLVTNFNTTMNFTQFSTAIGYLMSPNTVDSFPTQMPGNLGQVLDLLFPAVARFKQESPSAGEGWFTPQKPAAASEQKALNGADLKDQQQKELKDADSKKDAEVSKSSAGMFGKAVPDFRIRFDGALARTDAEKRLQGEREQSAILRLCGPRVEMMAGRLCAYGLNLVLSMPNRIEPAYKHLYMIYSVPILNLNRPTMFLSLDCHPRFNLDFVWKAAAWLEQKVRIEGFAGTAAPPEVRYFRRSAIGVPHAINQRAELMRLHLTELVPPPELRGLTQAPPPITAVVAAR